MNFQQGAMGPVNEISSLLRFWTQMEKLRYPLAADMRRSFEEELERQQQAAAQQQQQAAVAAMQGGVDTVAAPAMDAAMMEGGGMV